MLYGRAVQPRGTAVRVSSGYCHTDFTGSFLPSLTSHVGDSYAKPHNRGYKQRDNKRVEVFNPLA